MTPYLFVYGTLMRHAAGVFGRAERERLAREALWRGPAAMQGRLYSLGRYPGLVAEGGLEETVAGEVYELRAPARTLFWLDAFEGITGKGPPEGEYERLERPAMLAGGRQVSAWVYVCRRDVSRLRRLVTGRWRTGEAAALFFPRGRAPLRV